MKYILPQFSIPSIVQCSGFHQPKLFLTFIVSHYKITFRSFFFRKTNHFSPIQRKTNTKEYNWSLLKSDDNRAIIVARYLLFIYIYYKPSIGKVFNYLKKLDNDWSFWVFIEYKYKLANELLRVILVLIFQHLDWIWKDPYSVWMRKKAEQNNSKYEHFSRSKCTSSHTKNNWWYFNSIRTNYFKPTCRAFTFKDTIYPLELFVEKRQFFNQNNQWLNNIYH